MNYVYFNTREEARFYAAIVGCLQSNIMNAGRNAPKGRRWGVPFSMILRKAA